MPWPTNCFCERLCDFETLRYIKIMLNLFRILTLDVARYDISKILVKWYKSTIIISIQLWYKLYVFFSNYKPMEGFRKPSPSLNMILQITSFQFNVIWRNIKYELWKEKKIEYLSKMRLSAIYRLRQLHRRTRVINHKPVNIGKNFHGPIEYSSSFDHQAVIYASFIFLAGLFEGWYWFGFRPNFKKD